MTAHRQIYIDCDGVLADFDAGFQEKFRMDPHEAEEAWGSTMFWSQIKRVPSFYRNLPVMAGARDTMYQLHFNRPIILTGCPWGGWAETQKIEWAAEHFLGVPMICTKSKDKRDFCRRGDILVDDRDHYRMRWEEKGGIFVHHTSHEETMAELVTLGVIVRPKPEPAEGGVSV